MILMIRMITCSTPVWINIIFYIHVRQHGRVVKANDSKSFGFSRGSSNLSAVGYNILLIIINNSSIGAVGSASVLCTGGPGFEPLAEQYIYIYINQYFFIICIYVLHCI